MQNRLVLLFTLLGLTSTLAADNPFVGSWELTIPGGQAGWLGVERTAGGEALKASILWGSGSVVPVQTVQTEGQRLILTRNHVVQQKDASGKDIKKTIVETITATTGGQVIRLVSVKPRANGSGQEVAEFSGVRAPQMPPAPDLQRVQFGPAIDLFNGKDLTGWRLTNPNAYNGWSAKDGKLVNTVDKDEKPKKNHGNLQTVQEFGDFNLKLEARVGKGENSGVYLRGIYEVQVADTYGKQPDSHNMGAVYSRITPSVAAEKPPGEWQTMDITLVDRHVTVILNGKTIINNKPVAGCTGGALWSDTKKPGPIYLQGDHTGVEFRNLVLRPVL